MKRVGKAESERQVIITFSLGLWSNLCRMCDDELCLSFTACFPTSSSHESSHLLLRKICFSSSCTAFFFMSFLSLLLPFCCFFSCSCSFLVLCLLLLLLFLLLFLLIFFCLLLFLRLRHRSRDTITFCY